MSKYKIAILGCGAILNRHVAAIKANPDFFELVGIYDIDQQKSISCANELGVVAYSDLDDVYSDKNVNCIVILTPSNLHYTQALQAINHGKHLIIEKPATFLASEVKEIEVLAAQKNVDVFCILQVRLNKSIDLIKLALEKQLFGDIRGASLLQRWQRPVSYFSGWRGEFATSGGILREFAIHYIDIMQYLLGMPKVTAAQFFNTKFKHSDVNDSVYALCDYGAYGANIEVSVAAEPYNLECSLSIIGSNGYVKLSGKSLDVIDDVKFLDGDFAKQFADLEDFVNNKKIVNQVSNGACPHHPELYRLIIEQPKMFTIAQTHNVILLIEEIYKFQIK